MASKKYEIHQMIYETPKSHPIPSKNSLIAYEKYALAFASWCKENCWVKHFVFDPKVYQTTDDYKQDFIQKIQKYTDYLVDKGLSSNTIHTYVAGVCYAFDIAMDNINKPPRHGSENTKSRRKTKMDSRSDAKREASPRLYDFAQMVGIRRHEYLALRKGNWLTDESGYPCVEVTKGKGGKYQLQRILPEDVETVAAYFNGSADFAFSKAEMDNKIDLHAIRAQVAKRAYNYYTTRLKDEPEYRVQLTAEIKARWNKYHAQKSKNGKVVSWNDDLVARSYTVRGRNRKLAQRNGLPITYDRLAVMAISVFHLSHWRCDVTVDNYLLAVAAD